MLRLFATPKPTPIFPTKTCWVIDPRRYAALTGRKKRNYNLWSYPNEVAPNANECNGISNRIGQILADVENGAARKPRLLLILTLNGCHRDHRRNFHRQVQLLPIS